ncbi:hypothetical protein RM764_45650, partial [Streptomyces sp. DSM 41699]|nr:hypothetical protein [Streptomyces sp. DSM 41699]
ELAIGAAADIHAFYDALVPAPCTTETLQVLSVDGKGVVIRPEVVKDRLDITGARWGLAGAEAVLKLRALRSNGDFDAYWAWHEKQEFIRNHQARYRLTA